MKPILFCILLFNSFILFGQIKDSTTININNSKNPVIINYPKDKIEINSYGVRGSDVQGRIWYRDKPLDSCSITLFDNLGKLKEVQTSSNGEFQFK
ncbi:MAG: hypothetical protein R2852_10075 [Bacteroidia bacterium]